MSLSSQQPLIFDHYHVSFPSDHVILVTINRPSKLNCIDKATSLSIQKIWEQFDEDENLWVGIITGVGRAFCTGADLLEWNSLNRAGTINSMAAPGLAGLPRRHGKKPIIAAVNGLCMGGGFEMVANCDVVLAASTAVFSLPEASRGIVPVAGCLPRLALTLGLQRTMDLILTGRRVSAETLESWGLVTRIVNVEGSQEAEANLTIVAAAIQVAKEMCQNSPDALIVGRLGVRLAWEAGSVEDAVSRLDEEWYPRLMAGPNFAEGVQAFVEKRRVKWVNSKL